MLSRRQLCLNLLAGIFLLSSGTMALADDGSGSSGSGSGNSGSDSENSGPDHDNDGDDNEDDDQDDNEDDDQNEARQAVTRGDATALRDILRKVKKKYDGEIVHVGLRKVSNGLVYVIKLIDPSGKLLVLRVDAKNGAVLREQGI